MSLGDQVAALTTATQELQAQVTNTLAECCGGESSNGGCLGQITLNVPADYASLDAALTYLNDKCWSETVTPIIQLPEGNITFSAPVEIKKDGIQIQGAGVIETTITAHVSTEESDFIDVTLTVADSTGISVGLFAILSNITDTRSEPINPDFDAKEHEGCWKVIAVNGNNITIKNHYSNYSVNKILTSVPGSGTMTVFKTTLDFSESLNSGLVVSAKNLRLKDLVITGQKNDSVYGVELEQNATVNTQNLGVNSFGLGIFLHEKSRMTQESGQLACSAATTGMKLDESSTAIANTGIFTGNEFAGIISDGHSMVAIKNAICAGNGQIGAYCLNNSLMNACMAHVIWNGNVDYGAEQLAIIRGGDSTSFSSATKSPFPENTSGNNLAIISLCNALIVGD